MNLIEPYLSVSQMIQGSARSDGFGSIIVNIVVQIHKRCNFQSLRSCYFLNKFQQS